MVADKVTLDVKICVARDTHAKWTQANPLLDVGELTFSTDRCLFKVGDGVHRWNDLSYTGANEALSLKGVTVTATELNSLTGVTSPIQDQINHTKLQISETKPTFASTWFQIVKTRS